MSFPGCRMSGTSVLGQFLKPQQRFARLQASSARRSAPVKTRQHLLEPKNPKTVPDPRVKSPCESREYTMLENSGDCEAEEMRELYANHDGPTANFGQRRQPRPAHS